MIGGIENTLKKLVKIPKPEKTEILVVDASEGNLYDIKKEFPPVRWIYFHNKKNKKIAIPEQRNLGLKKAKGNIITFIGANCVPDKNWLIELAKPISDEAGYLHKFDFWFWCFKRIIFFKENREIKNETNKK